METNTSILKAEIEAQHLLRTLVGKLPGTFGQITRDVLSLELPVTETAAVGADPVSWAPRILALCCQAYRQPTYRAVPVGACLQMLGIVSSVLDVVQDGHWKILNAYSKGLTDPNTQAKAKAAVISNVGVTFIGLAWQALLECGPEYGIAPSNLVEIGQLIARRWSRICQAQHQDLTIGRTAITVAEYERIVEGKAGEIGGVITEAGALLAGETDPARRQLWRTLGIERTVAYQLVDDYKDWETDLLTGQQLSHLILYGLEMADLTQRQRLLTLLNTVCTADETSEAQQATRYELIAILDELGAKPYAESCILLHLQQAREALAALALPPAIHQELEQWVISVVPGNPWGKE